MAVVQLRCKVDLGFAELQVFDGSTQVTFQALLSGKLSAGASANTIVLVDHGYFDSVSSIVRVSILLRITTFSRPSLTLCMLTTLQIKVVSMMTGFTRRSMRLMSRQSSIKS